MSTHKPKKTSKKTNKQKTRLLVPFIKIRQRVKTFLASRPHRSFKRTFRYDYVRSLELPGYWKFTSEVRRMLWKNRRLFGLLTLTYALISGILVGMASQDTYSQLREMLQGAGSEIFSGNLGELGKAGLLLTTGVMGSLNQAPTDVQTVYSALLVILAWLTTVWLLRAIFAGQKLKLRDGLYASGAPIVPMMLMSLAFVVQLIPIALAAIGFTAATSTGLLDGGVEAMLFWVVALLLSVLSIYWVSTTIFALIVVTLPGMYPMRAFKVAGDLVTSRRIRILLRYAWLLGITVALWALIMIPVILLDSWFKSGFPALEWLPIVPVILLALSSMTVIWVAAYVYMLYRKVVDDDALPA